MASTYSSNLRLELIGSGEQQGVWNITTNTNLGTLLEEAIGGYALVTMADANYTLTTNFGATDEARCASIKVISSVGLTTTRNLVVPTIEKTYLIWNATSGGRSLQVKTSGGAGVTVANGTKALIVVDGTDCVIHFENPTPVASGGTGSTTASAARTALAVPGLADTNTFTGDNTFSISSGSNRFKLSANAGSGKYIVYRTSGLTRWENGSDSATESGANAGSNFTISRYDDSGVFISNPLTINRATGQTTISSLVLSTALPVSSGGTGSTSASAARTALGAVGLADANTFTADQTILLTGSNADLIIGTTTAGYDRRVRFATNGLNRFSVEADASSESGSNAGSNFYINRFDDAGNYIDSPVTIIRSTGAVTLKSLTLNTALAVAQGGTGSTTTSGARTALGAAGLSDANTFTNTQEIVLSSGSNRFYLSAVSGSSKYVQYRTSGSARWEVGANSTVESGANSGSDFRITAFDDTGTSLYSPISISRATGVVSLSSALPVSSGGTGATSASAARTALSAAGLADSNIFTATQTIARTSASASLYMDSNGGTGRSWLLTSGTGGAFTIYDSTAGRSVIDIRDNGDMVNVCAGALIGYSSGAGGTVTQLTSKATGVTLSTGVGNIVTAADALNAGATVTFTVTNTLLSSNDIVVVHRKSGGTAASYNVWVDSLTSGSYVIAIRNISGSNLSEALTLGVMVFNGATS